MIVLHRIVPKSWRAIYSRSGVKVVPVGEDPCFKALPSSGETPAERGERPISACWTGRELSLLEVIRDEHKPNLTCLP